MRPYEVDAVGINDLRAGRGTKPVERDQALR
jgi:hypothetical protein